MISDLLTINGNVTGVCNGRVANEPPLELTLDASLPVSFLISEAIRHFGEEWEIEGLEHPDRNDPLDLAADIGEQLNNGDTICASILQETPAKVRAERHRVESEKRIAQEAKDVKQFLDMLDNGIQVKKHDRTGKAKRRVLYSIDRGSTLQWHDVNVARNPAENKTVVLTEAKELRRGSNIDPDSRGERGTKTLRRSMSITSKAEQGARSLSLIFKDRTLDITLPSTTTFR